MTDLAQGGAGSGAQGSSQTSGSPGGAPAARAAQHEPVANRVSIDGAEYSTDDVRAALTAHAEAQARKATLPTSPNHYQIKNSDSFETPEGVKFQWDMNDPLLKSARELAHQRGLDQDSFSGFLDIYAANKIGEQQRISVARDAELSKLGSAAPQRVDAVALWLKAHAGNNADVLVNQLRTFPVASFVKTFETLMRKMSHQGGAQYQNGGRTQEETAGKIPGYDGMNFKQIRVAQMQRSMVGGGRGE